MNNMRHLILLAFTMISVFSYAQPASLRVDLFHTGDAETEIFSLDEVVIEPLPWPGSESQNLDHLNRGKYRFIVSDSKSKNILYTRSFSSIYGEWETTGEAKNIKRTFHESLRFPMPQSEVIVSIEKRDSQHRFQPLWQTNIDPQHYLHHRASAHYKKHVIAIEKNGKPSEKVDLLILGDGYTVNELGKFEASARNMTEALFATSPFKENRQRFNVWALAVPTQQSGVSRPSTGEYRDTALGATYDAFGSERYVLTTNNKAFRSIAANAPYEFVEIIVNNKTYGGGGIYGQYSTAAANSNWANYLFIHEFGHHFAGLADEYYTSSVAYGAPQKVLEPYEPNVTALLDGQPLKWAALVKDGTPLPTPWPKKTYEEQSYKYQKERAKLRKENKPESEMDKLFHENQHRAEALFSKAQHQHDIGAFQGGNYSPVNFYRSEINCLMFTRTEEFCQVCQNAIVDMIDLYAK